MSMHTLSAPVQAHVSATSAVDSSLGAIKELVDNSLDASSTSITVEIDQKSAGIHWLSVSDNGKGIGKSDISSVCLQSTTSKLENGQDFRTVGTLGFRGEALSSMALLSNGGISITSKDKREQFGYSWCVDYQGIVHTDSIKKVSMNNGTTIVIQGLYTKYPVRMKALQKKASTIVSKIEELINQYSLVYQNIRFELRKVHVVNKRVQSLLKNSIYLPNQSRSVSLFKNLVNKNQFIEDYFLFDLSSEISINYIFPKEYNESVSNANYGSIKVLSVNNHILNTSLRFGKTIKKFIKDIYDEVNLSYPQSWYLEFNIPNQKIDFNIEPKKDDCIIPSLNLGPLKDHLLKKLRKQEIPSIISSLTEFHETAQINENLSLPTRLSFDDDVTSSTSRSINDDWSHAMHDELSSDINTSQPSVEYDIIPPDEDITISKNLEVSNPFTLAKLASSKLFPDSSNSECPISIRTILAVENPTDKVHHIDNRDSKQFKNLSIPKIIDTAISKPRITKPKINSQKNKPKESIILKPKKQICQLPLKPTNSIVQLIQNSLRIGSSKVNSPESCDIRSSKAISTKYSDKLPDIEGIQSASTTLTFRLTEVKLSLLMSDLLDFDVQSDDLDYCINFKFFEYYKDLINRSNLLNDEIVFLHDNSFTRNKREL